MSCKQITKLLSINLTKIKPDNINHDDTYKYIYTMVDCKGGRDIFKK